MKRWVIASSLLLIALTNLVVIDIDGLAAITIFILYSPIIVYYVFVRSNTRLLASDKHVTLVLIGYLFFVCVINFGEVRWSSFGYSVLYCLFFIFVILYQHLISKEYFCKISKIIIYLYLINNLSAQVLFYFTDSLEPLQWILQGAVDVRTGAMKFYGFSSEPSYLAFVVAVAFLVYSRFSTDVLRSQAIVFLVVIFLVASASSVYGYILLSVIILDYLIKNNFLKVRSLNIILLVISLGSLAVIVSNIGGESRLLNLFNFIKSGNWSLDALRLFDSSAFMRFGPLFSYLEEMDFFSINTYLGYGPGAAATHFGYVFNEVIAESQKGYATGTINLGFFPAFLYDYGIIGLTLVCLIVLRRGMRGFISVESVIVFMMLFNANFNTQLFWYVWAMLFIRNQISYREPDVAMRVNSLRFSREVR